MPTAPAADGLMTLGFRVNAADLARFPKLRAVLRMGVGYYGIDRKAAAEKQVMVMNVPDYATTEVADHAMALGARALLHYDAQPRSAGGVAECARSAGAADGCAEPSASSGWDTSAPRWR